MNASAPNAIPASPAPGQPVPGSPVPGMPPRRAALIAVALVFFDSLLGQLATFPNLVPWYQDLAKPWFTPPNFVFGPAWTLLYALMALAFWRILILPPQPGRSLAIGLFLAQLALNVVWSFAFFAAHSPLLGLIDIIPQELLVIATALAFWRLDRLAGLCLLPLALWVAYATALNFEVWRLNG
ncbi:TspO/MBR family protein [Rhodoblastus sp.]|uniref:TspO/MBR family protein n=1 Tax=Rhodoblastus sp. TaxID=1962975 RepID=UPI0025D9594A|nr:TspO/MBR family protein [Rhodoblastus sp.]